MRKIFILLMFAFFFHSEEDLSQFEEDPFEDFNRVVFNVADSFDSAVLRPTAEAYSEYTPTFVKSSVSNFFNNLAEVDTIANQLLQGKFKLAIDDTFRFFKRLLQFFYFRSHFENFPSCFGIFDEGKSCCLKNYKD